MKRLMWARSGLGKRGQGLSLGHQSGQWHCPQTGAPPWGAGSVHREAGNSDSPRVTDSPGLRDHCPPRDPMLALPSSGHMGSESPQRGSPPTITPQSPLS